MKNSEINIRDPFVLTEGGKYYLYGTRAKDFGRWVDGVDVYVSDDLENWSEPIECLRSSDFGLNREVNWAPEVHIYKGAYYMFITFTQENGLRGTYILRAESPLGPFQPHSDGAVTPDGWECLDGTLYIEDGKPFIVFCHEHTQIIDGTICFAELSDDLKKAVSKPVTLFAASETPYSDALGDGHYVTDGPFMFKCKNGALLMLWSSFIKGQYTENMVRFPGGGIGEEFEHLEPLFDRDGGHGMIFEGSDGALFFTFHSPNRSGSERPVFIKVFERNGKLEK